MERSAPLTPPKFFTLRMMIGSVIFFHSNIIAQPSTPLPRLIFAATLALLAGCQAPSIPEFIDRPHYAQKPASLRILEGDGRRWLPILRTIGGNTALLTGDGSKVILTPGNTMTGGTEFGLRLTGRIGSAVPVSRDGYFLTAAHCIDRTGPMTLVAWTRGGALEKAPARLVWSSTVTWRGLDLALLHAPLAPQAAVPLANAAMLQPGDPVASSGWSWLLHPPPPALLSAGRVTALSPWQRDPSGCLWRSVQADIPFCSGDSGGPLVVPQGLVATNARIWPGAAGFFRALFHAKTPAGTRPSDIRTNSFAPDREWLRSTIEADRRHSRSMKGPAR